uniref:Uncharacterized protein n=1 Tax=Rhizophora mucronata TaxID=61149 RepID=A0A2P2NVU3_RHIMU
MITKQNWTSASDLYETSAMCHTSFLYFFSNNKVLFMRKDSDAVCSNS